MKKYKLRIFEKKYNVLFVSFEYKIDKRFLLNFLSSKNLTEHDIILLIECFAFLEEELKRRFQSKIAIIGGCVDKSFLDNFRRKFLIATGEFYKKYFSDINNLFYIDPINKIIKYYNSKNNKRNKIYLDIFSGKYVAIVISLKSGQVYPIEKLCKIKDKIEKYAKSVDILIFKDKVTEEALFNFDYDYYILTCCPRVIEDFEESLKRKCFHIKELL